MPKYAICLQHKSLTFRASHFVSWLTSESRRIHVEPMHEHTFRVRATIEGPLNQHEFVVDFVAALRHLECICKNLDQKILLPFNNDDLRVKVADGNVTLRFDRDIWDFEPFALEFDPYEKIWSYPEQAVQWFPCANATAESIAACIAQHFRSELLACQSFAFQPDQYTIRLELEEFPGCWAIVVI